MRMPVLVLDPMRAIQTKKYLYLFNPWSNGERIFATATNGTVTRKRMIATEEDEEMNKRLELYRFGFLEELYQVNQDPDCLDNLIDYVSKEKERIRLEGLLEEWMVRTKDPILETFRNRDDPELVEAYVQKLEAEANARRIANKPKSQKAQPADFSPSQPVQICELSPSLSVRSFDAQRSGKDPAKHLFILWASPTWGHRPEEAFIPTVEKPLARARWSWFRCPRRATHPSLVEAMEGSVWAEAGQLGISTTA